MNKLEIAKGIYRQNVYNVNLGDGHYSHITCYFDDKKNIIALFKAGVNMGMVWFEEDESLTPLNLLPEMIEIVRDVLLTWTYDHIQPVELYKNDPLWEGIFEITPRDLWVISHPLPIS